MKGLAILFPGQGSQHVGMGKDLCLNFQAAQRVFEEASDTLKIDMKRLCFEGPEEALRLTENTQPAILTMSIAVLRSLEGEVELKPSVLAGHSLGEYSALVAAGAMAFADAVRVVRKRGAFMQEAVPEGEGAMAALIGGHREAVEELCRQGPPGRVVSPANYNSPDQTVISGHRYAVERVMERAREKGIKRAVLLPVSAPFHCSLMEPAGSRLSEVLGEVPIEKIGIPVIANVRADLYGDPSEVRSLLTEQVSKPVRWQESMEKALSMGIDTFLELGPGKVLSGLMKRIEPRARTHAAGDVEGVKGLLRGFERG